MSGSRRPSCCPTGQHKGQAPALREIGRGRVQVGDGIGEIRFRIRDALFGEVGEAWDLVAEHLIHRRLLQYLSARCRGCPVIQEGGQYF